MNSLRHNAAGNWISLMDYASKRNVSLSTLRRHIKANKITYKIENGRYLLWDVEIADTHFENTNEPTQTSEETQTVLQQTQLALQKAQVEIAELKTLIALYEETPPQQKLHE